MTTQENTEVLQDLTRKSLLVQNILNTNGFFVDVTIGRKINIDKIVESRVDTKTDCTYVIAKVKDLNTNTINERGYKLTILNNYLAAYPIKLTTVKKFPIIKFTLIPKPTIIKKPKPQQQSSRPKQQLNNKKPNNKRKPIQKKQ